MQIRTKTGRILKMPSMEEDAAITGAAESDPDARPLTDEEWEAARPRRGRPLATTTKTRITIRIDAATVSAYKRHADRAGTSYQTLINQVLAKHAEELSSQDHP